MCVHDLELVEARARSECEDSVGGTVSLSACLSLCPLLMAEINLKKKKKSEEKIELRNLRLRKS